MNIDDCEKYVFELFSAEASIPGELGFTHKAEKDIRIVGYATNMASQVCDEAVKNKVDLIVTHHDAWDFIFGMKERCMELLSQHGVSHIFCHMPLDGADFGTNESIVKSIGARSVEKMTLEEGYWCGRIAEFEESIAFKELVRRVEKMCDEKVMKWRNNDRLIKRVGIVSGGGFLTSHMKEMIDKN